MRKQKVYIFHVFFSNGIISKQVCVCICTVYMYLDMYMYMSSYLSEFTKTDPKKQQTQSEYRRKKLSKLNIFNPTPPLAKMIKCMRCDAMKYESEMNIQTKYKTNPAS